MKSRLAFGLIILSILAAPIGVHAQLRGLLKKKADEVLKGKPAPAEPAKPADSTPSSPAPSSPGAQSSPASAPSPRADAQPPADPLHINGLDLKSSADRTLRGDGLFPAQGDWEQLPYIARKTITAAKALDEPARVAFVEKVGAVFKAIVMSESFTKAHAESIKQQYQAVDHGLKGLVSPEDLMTKGNYPAAQVALERDSSAALVEGIEGMSAADIQRQLADDLTGWTRRANDPARKDRAKYHKWVKDGEALQALGTSDVTKLRRGFAVLKSADNDGPATEEALFAVVARTKQEKEQLAYDKYNLKAVLKLQLSTFVAVVPTVEFAAATTPKNGTTVFVSPAFEKKGVVWKACYRAGKGASMAALAFAQGWLKEL